MRFDLQLFGGGTSITQAPAQKYEATPEQRELEREQLGFVRTLRPSMENLVKMGDQSLGGFQIQPNYGQLYNQGMTSVGNATQGINNLAQGQLSQGFRDSQQQYVKDAMKDYSSGLASFAKRGLAGRNSAVNDFTNQFESNLQANLLRNYNQDLATQSQLYNQQLNAAAQPLTFSNAAQEAATYLPRTYYGMAIGNNQPQSGLLGQYMQQQTALSSPAQSYATQNGPGLLGGLAGIAGNALGTAWGRRW